MISYRRAKWRLTRIWSAILLMAILNAVLFGWLVSTSVDIYRMSFDIYRLEKIDRQCASSRGEK